MNKNRTFGIVCLSKVRVPTLPFLSIKNSVLGSRYDLSLVFLSDKRARELNKTYRGRDYIPNILSFPIDKNQGEIFINLAQARRELKGRNESLRYFVGLLFIHGLLHLKGHAHGSTMEKKEKEILAEFHIANIAKTDRE